jgi:hypothetical protein
LSASKLLEVGGAPLGAEGVQLRFNEAARLSIGHGLWLAIGSAVIGCIAMAVGESSDNP